jgi:hypothetical protein
MAVPDSSPQASVGVSVRIPQMLMLVDGTFFPPGVDAIPWGRTSGPAGLALKPCRSVGAPAKIFTQDLLACGC